MNREQVIRNTEEFVKSRMAGYDSGHDWWHIERVRNLCKYINEHESIADPFTLEIAALLHDTADSKFNKGELSEGYKIISEFIQQQGLDSIKDQVTNAIMNVSFSNKTPAGNLKDPVLIILQDSDRIDAIGAIGIARAFNYGGFRNNEIYVPPDSKGMLAKSTIEHFYEKLLKLKDLMNTPTGMLLAEERHQFLEIYLNQFFKEWKFDLT
jgi:uncharacterized protein